MGKATHDSPKCSNCGYRVSFHHLGSCPRCGKIGKSVGLHAEEKLHVTESVHWQRLREYYEKRPIPLTILIIATFGSPFLGLVLAAWVGVVAGLLISVATLMVGFCAVIKVREIHER